MIAFDVANTVTGIGAGPDTGILGAAILGTTRRAAKEAGPLIKAGSAGGETAGKAFPQAVKDAAKAESPPSTCVFCRTEGTATQVDHAIPRARGGMQRWTTHNLLARTAMHRRVREIFRSIRHRVTVANGRPHIGRETGSV